MIDLTEQLSKSASLRENPNLTAISLPRAAQPPSLGSPLIGPQLFHDLDQNSRLSTDGPEDAI